MSTAQTFYAVDDGGLTGAKPRYVVTYELVGFADNRSPAGRTVGLSVDALQDVVDQAVPPVALDCAGEAEEFDQQAAEMEKSLVPWGLMSARGADVELKQLDYSQERSV